MQHLAYQVTTTCPAQLTVQITWFSSGPSDLFREMNVRNLTSERDRFSEML